MSSIERGHVNPTTRKKKLGKKNPTNILTCRRHDAEGGRRRATSGDLQQLGTPTAAWPPRRGPQRQRPSAPPATPPPDPCPSNFVPQDEQSAEMDAQSETSKRRELARKKITQRVMIFEAEDGA